MDLKEINDWFAQRYPWFRYGTDLIIKNGTLSQNDIDIITSYCLNPDNCPDIKIDISSISNTEKKDVLRILSLDNIKNVYGLATKKSIEFSKRNLSIVYGENGTGKSSYIKLLKNICNTRFKQDISGNIYLSDKTEPSSADINYTINNINKTFSWTPNNYCPDLKQVDIFDSKQSDLFIKNASTLTYEPPVLSLFNQLISMSEGVTNNINTRISNKISSKARMPSTYCETLEYKWYNSLNFNTNSREIEQYCSFDETKLNNLESRLGKLISEEDIKNEKTKLHNLEKLITYINNSYNNLGANKYEVINKLFKDVEEKKNTAELAATKLFSNCELEGIGSEIWKNLWIAAKNYSERKAYVNTKFPVISDNARCVLCHQKLSDEAKSRLNSFEEYIKGTTENEVQKSKDILSKAIDDLPILKNNEELKTLIDACTNITDDLASKVLNLNNAFIKSKSAISNNELKVKLPDNKQILSDLNLIKEKHIKTIQNLIDDSKNNDIDSIKNECKTLKAKKWLYENKESIISEIQRLKEIKNLKEKNAQTNTRIISNEKSKLSEKLITEEFAERFNKELQLLNVKVKAEIKKEQVSKGNVYHKVVLKNTKQELPLIDILSEGEYRIISIAAFLADEHNNNVPFIFDDPISSLDEKYEKTVANRFVELAQSRQVIIFTHRLSFMYNIKTISKLYNLETTPICINKENWGAGEPTLIPICIDKPENALNRLLREQLPQAKKYYNQYGSDEEYYSKHKALCSNFRIIIERMVENKLLLGIVERFKLEINTKGKVESLYLIKREDCQLFDNLMTKYSYYEHSQPAETPIDLLPLEELEKDFESLLNWSKEYTKRRKAS